MTDFNAGGIADINTVSLTGNLARDGELRGDGNVLSLRLAYNTRKKEGDAWGTVANYIDVVVFGKLGAAIADRCKTGTPIAISAELRQTSYTPEGADKPVYRHELVADSVKILHRKNGNSSGSSSSSEEQSASEPVAAGADSPDTPF